MRNAEDIIIKPYITEQSNEAISTGRYTFVVDVKATKTEIRVAVEKLFDVKVLSVNTANYMGKEKRLGKNSGKTSNWKKAIVKINTKPGTETYLDKGGKTVTVNRKYKTSIEEFGAAQ